MNELVFLQNIRKVIKKQQPDFKKQSRNVVFIPLTGFEFLMNVNLHLRLFCQFSFVTQSRCIWPDAVTKLCFCCL